MVKFFHLLAASLMAARTDAHQEYIDTVAEENQMSFAAAAAKSFKLTDGICQFMFGYRVFDLNIVDDAMKLSNTGLYDLRTPNQLLEFRLCNQGLDIDDEQIDHMVLDHCENRRHAYLGEKQGADSKTKRMDYKCIRSFATPEVTGYFENSEQDLYSGYDLKMKSTQQEKGGAPLATLTFKVRCDAKDKSDKVEWKQIRYTSQEMEFEYTGKYGCHIIDIKPIEQLRQFVGPISLVLGFLLTFFGSKFIIMTISILIFLGVVTIVLILAINFHIVTLDGGSDTWAYLTVTCIVGILLGILTAWSLAKFTKKFAVAILAAWSGATVTMMVVTPL